MAATAIRSGPGKGGVTPGTAQAGKPEVLDTAGALTGAPLSTVGVAGALVTAVETGDGIRHVTRLTLASFAVGTSGDNASKAIGAVIYTLPTGAIAITRTTMDVALTLADAVQTDTPEIGIGNVVASGVNATLGAVGATSENVFEGEAVADVAGTSFRNGKAPLNGTGCVIRTGDAHALYLNVADGWADLTAASAVTATGVIVLEWTKMA